jgi:peptidoglycan/xylan/chitin deacetylase (PgdA/CDA1 family)
MYAQPNTSSSISNPALNNKLVILTFGDTLKSQFDIAKPILDKYNFKASFFITCGYVSEPRRMSWQDIVALQKDGQDIESKTMTHRTMTDLTTNQLIYETGGSKKCLAYHGINATIFGTPHGNEWNNATVINAISKYYDYADNGFAPLMFLHCDGYKRFSSQTDCRTYYDNWTLTFANRYSIREWSHNAADKLYSYNDTRIFTRFVQEVNGQAIYNDKHGNMDAIPVVAYHSIDNNKTTDSTDIRLFTNEMKYLHDNGFRVIPMTGLGYDNNSHVIIIKPT